MRAQHDHYQSKMRKKIWGNLFAFPLRKQKRNKISGFSFVIVSVRMVQRQLFVFGCSEGWPLFDHLRPRDSCNLPRSQSGDDFNGALLSFCRTCREGEGRKHKSKLRFVMCSFCHIDFVREFPRFECKASEKNGQNSTQTRLNLT